MKELFGNLYDSITKDNLLKEQFTELGKIVFADAAELQALNAIMHPAVKNYIREKIELERQKGTSLFVLEAALLIEERYDEICDELWYIYTDEANRRKRLKDSRGYTDSKIDSMMATQLSEEMFRKYI